MTEEYFIDQKLAGAFTCSNDSCYGTERSPEASVVSSRSRLGGMMSNSSLWPKVRMIVRRFRERITAPLLEAATHELVGAWYNLVKIEGRWTLMRRRCDAVQTWSGRSLERALIDARVCG